MSSDFTQTWRPSLQVPVPSPAPAQTQARVNYIESEDTWGVTTVQSRLAPARPVVAITLGPEDESGGVLLEGSDLPARGWRLGVDTPFAGVGGGEPIKVTPIAGVALTPPSGVTASLYNHRRDLLMWHVMPSQFPGRAELRKSGTLSAVSGTPGTAVVCTMGRKRVRVTVKAPSAELTSLVIYGEVIGPAGAIITVPWAVLSGLTLNATYEWSPQSAPDLTGAPSGAKGWSAPDFVRIVATNGGGGTITAAYSVTAWDE